MGLRPISRNPIPAAQPCTQDLPYLLRKMVINRPSQVWATDVTYPDAIRLFLPDSHTGLVQHARTLETVKALWMSAVTGGMHRRGKIYRLRKTRDDSTALGSHLLRRDEAFTDRFEAHHYTRSAWMVGVHGRDNVFGKSVYWRSVMKRSTLNA